MKNGSKPKSRTISRIGICLVVIVAFFTVSLQAAVREKPAFTGNSRLFNYAGNDTSLFSPAYWSGKDMSNWEPGDSIDEKPRVSTGKLFGEIFVGILGNVGGGILGALVGSQLDKGYDDDEGLIAMGSAVGFFPGAIFGSALGVYAIGNSGDAKGSFGQALLGSFLGECAAIVVSLMLHSGEVLVISIIVLPPVGAALLFNSSLKYKSLPVSYGLLNFHKGDLKVGIPYVHIQRLPGYSKNNKTSLGFSVNLVNIVF
jgi:hypothetical protein